MRGLAALMVLVGHCLSVAHTNGGPAAWLNWSLNGEGAVAFFFILSGTVLGLSWHGAPLRMKTYAQFLVRRAFRIMPMLVVAATIGTIYCNFIDRRLTYDFATNWFDQFYKIDVDFPRYIASLVGYSARPAAPLWSIFVEIIGSILIPVMIFGAASTISRIAIGLLLLGISFAPLGGFQYSWPAFLINFYIGITVPWWGPALARQAARKPQLAVLLVSALVFVFIVNRHVRPPLEWADPVTNVIEALAVTPIIALALYAPRGFGALRHRWLARLGDWSYSVYLLHFPIMCAITQILVMSLSSTLIEEHLTVFVLSLAAATAAVTLILSRVTYRCIERPGIAVGRMAIRGPWAWRTVFF